MLILALVDVIKSYDHICVLSMILLSFMRNTEEVTPVLPVIVSIWALQVLYMAWYVAADCAIDPWCDQVSSCDSGIPILGLAHFTSKSH
jgi:hypothetical protein